MRRLPTLACCLAVAAAGLGAQVYRGGADVVILNVTVTDAEAHFIPGLDRPDFKIFEDGVPQEVSTFARDPQPVALSILIDTSASMDRKLPIAQEGAVGFAKRLGPKDMAEVIAFDTRPDILQELTGDRVALERAIRRTQVGGSTALYNAIYIALNRLSQAKSDSPDTYRRQAIVLLSDGEDTSSVLDYDSVLDAARRSEAGVYAIALRSREDTPVHGFNAADYVLRTLTQETGGRVYHVDDVAQLAAIYQQVADELASQYYLGYTSKNSKRDGAWRRIAVRVDRPNVLARTKAGYFAATTPR